MGTDPSATRQDLTRTRSDQESTANDDYVSLLPDTQNWGLHMRRECRERFPCHRGLAIPTCITARAAMHAGIAN